jgi:AraC-like DNA-binding protein
MSFWYSPEFFEEITADRGLRPAKAVFPVTRVPSLSRLSPMVARVGARLTTTSSKLAWEQLSLELVALTIELVHGVRVANEPSASDQARVTAVIRSIEQSPDAGWSLREMAAEAGFSPHHFLRTFEAVAGVTPHQFLVRARLREAAVQLMSGAGKILDVALECGFGDVSNFNRAFHREFGVSPRAWRRKA